MSVVIWLGKMLNTISIGRLLVRSSLFYGCRILIIQALLGQQVLAPEVAVEEHLEDNNIGELIGSMNRLSYLPSAKKYLAISEEVKEFPKVFTQRISALLARDTSGHVSVFVAKQSYPLCLVAKFVEN